MVAGGAPRVVVGACTSARRCSRPDAHWPRARRPDRPAVDARRRRCRTSRRTDRRCLTPDRQCSSSRTTRACADRRAPPARPTAIDVEEADSAEAAVRGLDGGLRPDARAARPEPAGRHRLGPAPRARRCAAAGSPPVVITSATTVSPRRLREFGVAGYLPKPFPLETLVATIERLARTRRNPSTAMTDLQILLIARRRRRRVRRLRRPVRPRAPMNALELLTALAAAFVFVYLLWALLRPEDF